MFKNILPMAPESSYVKKCFCFLKWYSNGLMLLFCDQLQYIFLKGSSNLFQSQVSKQEVHMILEYHEQKFLFCKNEEKPDAVVDTGGLSGSMTPPTRIQNVNFLFKNCFFS